MQGDWRSNSYGGDGRMQMVVYGGRAGGGAPPSGLHELRSFSTSYTSSRQQQLPRELKVKKGKSIAGPSSSPSSSSSKGGGWGFNDPEFQRKKRVAGYKVYSVESKMKGSIRKSFRWLKDRYTHVVYGWW